MTLLAVAVLDAHHAADALRLSRDLASGAVCVSHADLSMLAIDVTSDAPPNFSAVAPMIVRCIATMHARFDVLPLRLGDSVASETEAAALLERRASHLHAALDRIRGCTEYGVRLTLDAASTNVSLVPQPECVSSVSTSAPATGTRYLASRAAHYAAVDGVSIDLERRVRTWLSSLALADVQAKLEPPSRLVPSPSIALLVPRRSVDRFIERYHEHAHNLGVRATLTGPFAPYSFATSAAI